MNKNNITILLIEDEEIIRENLKIYFEDEGYCIYCAQNTTETFNLVNTITFDVAIVDMRLPDGDGNTLILKINELQPDMKFIIHTGSTSYSLPEPLKAIGIEQKCIFFKPVMQIKQMQTIINELVIK